MTSSQRMSLMSEVTDGEVLSKRTLGYFRERLISRLYALVLNEFSQQKKRSNFTKAKLARRIQKDPSQVNRLMDAPHNWTLETLSDLLVGLGAEPKIDVIRIAEEKEAAVYPPDWLRQTRLPYGVVSSSKVVELSEVDVQLPSEEYKQTAHVVGIQSTYSDSDQDEVQVANG